MKKNIRGFTIVELLIVIVVIAILAAITIVAFNGIQSRARDSIMSSALSQAVKKVKLHAVDNSENYPTDLNSIGVTGDDNTTYQYVVSNASNPKTFCITASNGGSTKNVNQSSTISSGPCSGHYANQAKPFSNWSIYGGATYDSSKSELVMSNTTGDAISPIVNVANSSYARIIVNAYATQPSPNGSPDSRFLYTTNYYASDGVTPAANSNGYTGNGSAGCIVSLNVWQTCSSTMATGPNVHYIRYTIVSSPSNWTSDNRYKNVQISALP